MSGPRLYRDYLYDMLDAAEKAESFLGDLAFDDFAGNAEKVFAIIRALEIIGEAASKVTVETRELLPHLPWHEIIGMRNRIIHAYDRVNYDVVWDTANLSVPLLIKLLEDFLPPETDASEPE